MTNLEMISDAYRKIGLISESEAPDAAQGQQGLRMLNQLLALWSETDITFPSWFPQTTLADTTPVPDWAEMAITYNLAIIAGAHYGLPVSAETAAIADSARGIVLRKRLLQKNQPVDLSHLPQGEAWRGMYSIADG
jgi:hypothetical protein